MEFEPDGGGFLTLEANESSSVHICTTLEGLRKHSHKIGRGSFLEQLCEGGAGGGGKAYYLHSTKEDSEAKGEMCGQKQG